jgi:hypothetical protein
MPFNLPILTASAIAVIAVLSLLGWPRLRLRTHSQAHGGLRVIELALILSRTATRPQGWWYGVRRLARRSPAFAPPVYGPATAALGMERVQPGVPRADALATSGVPAAGAPSASGSMSAAAPIKGATAVGQAWAECVVYVTLKVGSP